VEPEPKDRRSDIPDIGLGRLTDAGAVSLQGGAEQKPALTIMSNLPRPLTILENGFFELPSILRASRQMTKSSPVSRMALFPATQLSSGSWPLGLTSLFAPLGLLTGA